MHTDRVTPLLEELEEGLADLRRRPLGRIRHSGASRGGDVGMQATRVSVSVVSVVSRSLDEAGCGGCWRWWMEGQQQRRRWKM